MLASWGPGVYIPCLGATAPMAKLVDARDLKSLVLWTCRFDPGSGHHIYIKGLRGILLSRPFLLWSAKTVVVRNS